MMRMTYASLSNFIKHGQEHVMEHLVTMAEGRGATTTNPKMVPRQRSGPGNSWRYRCKRRRADMRNMLEMVGCSRLPGSHGTMA